MQVKTNWFYALLILLLVSCGEKKTTEQEKEKKDTVQTPKEEEKKPEADTKTSTADLLIGEWELVKEIGLDKKETKATGSLKFTKDTFEEVHEKSPTKGQWDLRKVHEHNPESIDGFTIYADTPENVMPYTLVSISQEELVMNFYMGEVRTYKRKK
jgi:hypothetical protein